MDYRVTRLLEPELGPLASASGAIRHLKGSRLRPWMGIGLLMLVPGLLSGGQREASAAAINLPATVDVREEMTMNEWIRLVGVAPTVEVEPPRPQWSIRLPEVDASPGARQLLAGNARSLSMGTLPVELGRLLKVYQAANSKLELATAAAGQVRLVGGELPPWMWENVEAVRDAPQAGKVLVTLPPELDRGAGLGAWIEGINYSDPTGIGLPLRRAGGFMESRISEHFLVRDFATRDRAPYLRVADDLVAGLERLRSAVGPIEVISGYRHPRYNARPEVGGARYSRHQAGQAADVYSPTESSIRLAQAAIQTMGCGIGLGLGRNTVHIDVRGYLSTWTYPGAPLREAVFKQWILTLCGGSAPQAPPRTRYMSNEEWLTLLADGTQDGEEMIHLNDEVAEEDARSEGPSEAPPAVLSVDQLVQRDLAEFARISFWSDGPGVVVVDLRDGAALEGSALRGRARYVPAASPEVRGLSLGGLLEWVGKRPGGTFFAYAIRLPGGELRTGVAPSVPLPAGTVVLPPAVPAQPESRAPILPAPSQSSPAGTREAPVVETSARWLVLLDSSPSPAAMEQDVVYYQTLLAATGYTVAPYFEGRAGRMSYHAAVGPFTDRATAQEALQRVRPFVGAEAKLLELAFGRTIEAR